MLFEAGAGSRGMEQAVEELCLRAGRAVDEGYNYVIISDRGVNERLAPIPSLLALSAVHHYLIGVRKRSQIALIVESGEVCETMHVALLIGYGASAVNPYMAFGVLDDLVRRSEIQLDYPTAEKYYVKAINKGMLKIMSKMGISTIRSYRGAKLFNTLGLAQEVLTAISGAECLRSRELASKTSLPRRWPPMRGVSAQRRWRVRRLKTPVSTNTAKEANTMHGSPRPSPGSNNPPVRETTPSSRSTRISPTMSTRPFFCATCLISDVIRST